MTTANGPPFSAMSGRIAGDEQQVYANGREVSCKSGAGKSTAAFPDVCLTPPLSPADPARPALPYPNTGMVSDTWDGNKTV